VSLGVSWAVLGLVSLAGIDDRANFAHVALMGFANESILVVYCRRLGATIQALVAESSQQVMSLSLGDLT
jgi:hypothetical protein